MKLEESKVETIFKKRRGCNSFIYNLNSLGSFLPSLPHSLSSSKLPKKFYSSSFSSFETSTELIPDESNLPSKSSFQDENLMRLVSSRLESIRTTFGNLSKSSFESSTNPSSYDSRVETNHSHFHSSSSEFRNHRK